MHTLDRTCLAVRLIIRPEWIALRPRKDISQQHGFVHAGAVSAIADSASGYAALILMPASAC